MTRQRRRTRDRREYSRNYMRQRYQQNPWAARKYTHGRDIAEVFAAMWDAQHGLCYLCDDPLRPGRETHIEHDHRCCPNAHSCAYCRRGLACHRCNAVTGHAGDDPARLRLIADRLEAASAAVTARLATKPQQGELLDLQKQTTLEGSAA